MHCTLPRVKIIEPTCCPVNFYTTEVAGTLEDNPPVIGKYRNILAVYQNSGARVLYASDGIPSVLVGDGGDPSDITNFTTSEWTNLWT